MNNKFRTALVALLILLVAAYLFPKIQDNLKDSSNRDRISDLGYSVIEGTKVRDGYAYGVRNDEETRILLVDNRGAIIYSVEAEIKNDEPKTVIFEIENNTLIFSDFSHISGLDDVTSVVITSGDDHETRISINDKKHMIYETGSSDTIKSIAFYDNDGNVLYEVVPGI